MAEQQQELLKSGCFSRFSRLLLCAHSDNAPLIHPSDRFPSHQTLPSLPNKPSFSPDPVHTTPGVVARLMGLDSLPNTSRISSRVAPDSVPRSKSVNFLDSFLQFDPAHPDGSHRRVRTSSSFREVPASSSFTTSLSFQQEKNRDFVVFLWDDTAPSKSKARPSEVVRLSTREHEVCQKESKKQKGEGTKKKKISRLKNEPRRVSASRCTRNEGSCSLSPRMKKEAMVEPRLRKRVRSKKPLKKMQNEGCSENLSPISVLDVGDDQDFTFKNKTNFLTDEKDYGLRSKSKTKSSAGGCLFEGVEEIRGSTHKSETEHCSEIMAKLRKLTEMDVQKFEWGPESKFGSESSEEICFLFEHKIFDLLLRELVDELLTF